MKRSILAVVVIFLLGVSAVWFAIGRSNPVNAQSGDDSWQSSANPPAGLSPADLSPPDGPPNITPEDVLEGGGLISWRVVGSALKPRESTTSYSVDVNGSCAYVTAGSNFNVWNTPVHLPHGATVDTLRMYYYDTNAANSTAWFTVYDLYGAIVQEWSVSSSGNSGNSFNDTAQINHTIDYSIYSYVINWRPLVTGSTMQLCGFRVFHNPPPYGLGFIPAVLNP